MADITIILTATSREQRQPNLARGTASRYRSQASAASPRIALLVVAALLDRNWSSQLAASLGCAGRQVRPRNTVFHSLQLLLAFHSSAAFLIPNSCNRHSRPLAVSSNMRVTIGYGWPSGYLARRLFAGMLRGIGLLPPPTRYAECKPEAIVVTQGIRGRERCAGTRAEKRYSRLFEHQREAGLTHCGTESALTRERL